LSAGERESFAFEWNVNDTGNAHTLTLVADPEDVVVEANETNNVITLTTVLPDLNVAWRVTDYNTDAISVTVGIANDGVIATSTQFDVELRDGSESGGVYASEAVGVGLAAGEIISVMFVFDDVSTVPSSAITSYAIVDAGEDVTEAKEGNNASLVDVPRHPDLTVGPYDLNGAPSQRLTVHNRGPVAASDIGVAIYQGDGVGNLLFDASVASLSPGSQVEIPIWGPPGELQLTVRVDPNNQVIEGDESNNVHARAITVWPRVFLPVTFKALW
jgi:subtilase family serine protease